jgi:hypothetical protein
MKRTFVSTSTRIVIGGACAFTLLTAESAGAADNEPQPGQIACDCVCGASGSGSGRNFDIAAPNNDPAQCANLNGVDCSDLQSDGYVLTSCKPKVASPASKPPAHGGATRRP